jgi:2-polyprenyl-3-methyl-5-hydroxy-6-metoxy-1,4-benzoquinol methylase
VSADRETIAFYDREAAAYAARVTAHGRRPSLEAFEALLPRRAAVLDFGCGGGQDGAWLRERGHRVTAMDASPGLAEVARTTFGLDVRVAAFEALDDVAAYDGVWSAAALHHAETAQLPAIVARIARALKPGGVLAATMKAGDDRRDALGRFYCAMDAASARALFAAGHWTDVDVRETEGEGYDGVAVPWLVISAVKV